MFSCSHFSPINGRQAMSQRLIQEAETTNNPLGTRLSHHNLRISRDNVGHLEKVYSNVRQKHGRQPGDDVLEIDVNAMI